MNQKDIISQCANKWDSFYLYDEESILKNIKLLKSSFPQIDFLYSIKCNANPHVLHCMFKQGFGADAASYGEVLLAKRAGLTADRIYYSAPGKSISDIKKSLAKATLIADSTAEIIRIQAAAEKIKKKIAIGIRINPNFSFDGEEGIPSKFGIDEDLALQLVKNHPYKNIKISGLHIHLRSQILSTDSLLSYYKKVILLAKKFAAVCGGFDYINMGSGIGVAYTPADQPLDIAKINKGIQRECREFQSLWPNTRLIIEVGRYAVCKSGVYVTKVMDKKVSHGKTYLILKNTLNGFLRPSLAKLMKDTVAENSSVSAEPLFTSAKAFAFLSLKEKEPRETVSLAGNLCTSADMIAEDIVMPRLEAGDAVIITNAGSYAAVLSPFQFSSQEKPAELFLTQSGEILSPSSS